MKILAPASNLEDAKQLVDNGAEAIYAGAVSMVFKNYSYNGRSMLSKKGKLISPDFTELKRIYEYVHSKGGDAYFLANSPFLYDGQDKESKLASGFLDYIHQGRLAGCDYIVLGDIGAIKLIRDTFPDAAVVASSYLEIQNELSLKFFEDLGVKQVILSYQSTMDEINYMTSISTMDIEVFGHGGCSFYVGSCNLFHEMGEQPINVGYPCRAVYHIRYENRKIDNFRVLDNFKICSLCSLPNLLKCNVKTFKIVGRDLDSEYILQLVKIYKNAINEVQSGKRIEDIKEKLPVWWRKAWCEPGCLCKYR
ncbi:MAG: collagenase-like protease [Herbinix sp.]|jgi:putative protease|nr:collagenase-like protease [Herbinix sp.]